MASAREHMVIGATVTTASWLLFCWLSDRPVKFGEILMASAIGILGGLLPDILEPPDSPDHRQFFHSVTFACLAGYANAWVAQNDGIDAEAKSALHLAFLAFCSHLLADAQTPKGLPLV